jgi:hypothetical protein
MKIAVEMYSGNFDSIEIGKDVLHSDESQRLAFVFFEAPVRSVRVG